MKKIISLIIVFSFLCANQVWAARLFYAPMTSNANATIHDASSVAATVSGPDGWYTWVDTDGVLQGTDAQASPRARIEADGLLCEGMGVNLLAESTDFSEFTAEDDIASAANSTGPELGANTAYTVTDNGGNANDWFYYSVGADLEADYQYTMSVYVKEGTATSFSILLHNETDSTNDILIDYEWTANVLSEKAADAGTSTVNQLGSTDWWRIKATAAANIIDNGDEYHFCLTASEVGSDPGASKTVVFYGAQLEKSPYVTSYIPTSGAPAVRWSQKGAVDTTDVIPTYNTSSFNIDFSDGSADCQTDEYLLDTLVLPVGSDKYRIRVIDDEADEAVGYIYADDPGQAGGILVSSTKDGATRNWDKDGGFNEADDEYDIIVEFVENNGIYWPHASLWETDWATDMDPEGTMSVEWTPGVSDADLAAGNFGAISPITSNSRLFYFNRGGTGTIVSNDSTNVCQNEAGITNGTTISVVITWDDDIDADGSLEVYADGTASGDEEEYGGAFPTTTDLVLGFDNPYPFHLKDLRFYGTYTTYNTVDIHIANKVGADLQGATVACDDTHGTAAFTSQTTGADGTISQQNIWYHLSPYEFTFSYPAKGYKTLVWEQIDWEKAIDWHLELQPAHGAFPSPWR